MSEQTIKGMHKKQIVELFENAINDINIIRSAKIEIDKNNSKIDDSNNRINGEDGILSKIELAMIGATEKLQKIEEAYSKIYENDAEEEEESIKNQLEGLLEEFKKDQKKIEEFKNKIWGFTQKIEGEEEDQKIKGLFENINDFHDKQKIRYDALYNKIETELLSGATTASLASVFKNKVDRYKDGTKLWSILFVVVVSLFILYYGYSTIFGKEAESVGDIFIGLAFRSPFIAFGIWLAVFFGNRRAESKKLEEAYTHKEVMARSYTGYKKAIEELDDTDKELLKKHMDNLLEAINQDSGTFLGTKGENYPMTDAISESGKKAGSFVGDVMKKVVGGK